MGCLGKETLEAALPLERRAGPWVLGGACADRVRRVADAIDFTAPAQTA